MGGLRGMLWLAAGALAADLPLEEPSLDVSARSRAVAVQRRAEAREARLGPAAFPQNQDSAGFHSFPGLSAWDNAWLEGWEPGFRAERVHWRDSARGNFLTLRSEMLASGTLADDSLGDRALGGLGITLYGQALRILTFYSRGFAYTERTGKAQFAHQFDPEFGETYSVDLAPGDSLAKARTFNRFEYYLKYRGRVLTVKAGRDFVHLGPGYFSSLTATRDAPPYYLLEARLDFAPWLSLDDYLIRMTDTRHDLLKYAHVHRFEIRPHRSLSLSFQDVVIYQDRDPDARYLLPLVPLAFSEDNNGGLDNDAMHFDFLYAPVRCVSLWGELFIDDLTGPAGIFDDFWENRWAALAGFQLVSPWKTWDADLIAEYSHVEPWTYIGRSPQTGFKHFNVPSASKLGPDSRSWDVQAGYRPWKWLEIRERLEWNDNGLGNPSNLSRPHSDSDGTTKKFLGGTVERKRISTLSATALWGRLLLCELYWRQGFGVGTGREFGARASVVW